MMATVCVVWFLFVLILKVELAVQSLITAVPTCGLRPGGKCL